MIHLNDDAELYALGLTEREREGEIEVHLARCTNCLVRVIAAEATGAALAGALAPAATAASQRPTAPQHTRWMPVAVAASVLFATTAGLEGVASNANAARLAHTDIALNEIAASHFRHTTLTSESGIIAKALYAPDGSWCYVIAANAPPGARVSIRHARQTVDGGAMHMGTPSTLLLRDPGKPDEIDIIVGDHIVARGRRPD